MKPEADCFDATWRAACTVAPISRRQASAMIRQHYLGRWPGVTVLSLGLWRRTEPLGVIVYALPPRETNKRLGCESWELARLWVSPAVPQNGESWLIAQSIKYIRRKHPDVGCLVSYADPTFGHSGTIYRASNWLYDGRTDQERKTARSDYADAETGQKYSRRGHIPAGVQIVRQPRASKHRFLYRLQAKQASARPASMHRDLLTELEAA